jgi:antitoxin component YwqK of YwqJK toxin-antitoxin module
MKVFSVNTYRDTIILTKYENIYLANDEFTGKCIKYFDVRKKKVNYIGYYNNGIKDSVWTYYSKKGSVMSVVTYKKGKLITYTNYTNGKKNNDPELTNFCGLFIYRNYKGKTIAKFSIKDGVLDGESKEFNERTGKLIYTEYYKNDTLDGVRIWENGIYDEYYQKGKLIWAKLYYRNTNKNKIRCLYEYKEGIIVSITKFNKNGVPVTIRL